MAATMTISSRLRARPQRLPAKCSTGARRSHAAEIPEQRLCQCAGLQHALGKSARNSFQGYVSYSVDIGLSKSFAVTEQVRVLFRSEGFNLFNHSNLTAPDGNISNSTLGVITNIYPARVLQFALEVQF